MPTIMARQPVSSVDASNTSDIAEIREAEEAGAFTEQGITGLKRAAGYVDEEFLPELRGRKGVAIYREMGDNDAIVGTLLFALTYLLRETSWSVKEAGINKESANAAKFLDSNMDDMSSSWGDTIAEILSCLQYGWSWHEIVLKRRMGMWQKDERLRSKYSDGLYGIRKLPIRAQETMQRWVFDEHNEVIGMIQMAPPDYQTRPLPLSKSLLFRTGIHKGNPEGRSILRTSYRTWFMKKRMEEHEAIGVERDLAGLPMVSVPSSYLKAPVGSEKWKMVQALQKMVRSVRRNEQEGLVFPRNVDDDTKQDDFAFELVSSGGSRQFATNEIIQRLETRILMTCLADFILVGHEETGTYNMHADKRGIFNTSLNVTIQMVADILNRHLVPRLFMANGWRPAELPELVPANVDAPDIAQLGAFLAQTAGLGFAWGPDAEMERYLRDSAGLPELSEAAFNQRRILARRTNATRMAETQTAYLAAKSQLAQQQAANAQMAAGDPTPEHAQAIAGAQQQAAQGQQDAAAQQSQSQNDQAAAQQAQEAHDASMKQSQVDLMSSWRDALTPGGGKKK